MSYQLSYTNQYAKSLKKCVKRGLNIQLLQQLLDILIETGALPPKYRPHKLSGKYAGIWECHIQPDWLLLWEQDDNTLTLLLLDTGSHSDIF